MSNPKDVSFKNYKTNFPDILGVTKKVSDDSLILTLIPSRVVSQLSEETDTDKHIPWGECRHVSKG